jgi:hypothetical protein
VEEEGKNALEVGKEEKKKDKARTEEKSGRTLIRPTHCLMLHN